MCNCIAVLSSYSVLDVAPEALNSNAFHSKVSVNCNSFEVLKYGSAKL